MVTTYADDLVAIPRAHLTLELRQDQAGLKLLHQGNLLVECYLTREGMIAATYFARAFGVGVPPIGESTSVRVSTGVLFRAISIASLDLSVKESFILIERLIGEADLQRKGSRDDTY